ncbi:hypothetical protein K280104A7_12790 [Candidatus Bariatricus faecipullorum]
MTILTTISSAAKTKYSRLRERKHRRAGTGTDSCPLFARYARRATAVLARAGIRRATALNVQRTFV